MSIKDSSWSRTFAFYRVSTIVLNWVSRNIIPIFMHCSLYLIYMLHIYPSPCQSRRRRVFVPGFAEPPMGCTSGLSSCVQPYEWENHGSQFRAINVHGWRAAVIEVNDRVHAAVGTEDFLSVNETGVTRSEIPSSV
jgi:hypothetical protein